MNNDSAPLIVPEPRPPKHRTWRDPNLSLVGFLGVALVIATIIVAIAHVLYVRSDEYKLDLTRPGLKGINQNDLVNVDSTKTYDSTSPITRAALDGEIKAMASRQQELSRYGSFDINSLSGLRDSLLSGEVNPGQ